MNDVFDINDINNVKKWAICEIEKSSELFCDLSDKIWELAELSLKEFKSAETYCDLLEKFGFNVERELCGISTAFSGNYGSGRPVIGILGEFDALSGLSQEKGTAEQKEITKGGNGHGCGHNMLGAGALAAAYGVKRYLEQTGKSGTVIFYGTPGEEGGAGKAFMAKSGLWYGLDCALTWHPDDVNEVATGTCNSCIQTLYKFSGIASHAAGDPEHGRSALDAMELMNVGVQYLREHMKEDARIHYAIVDGGGLSPNVVQSKASVLYMVRSMLVKDALALQARVDKIAEGAVLMTETTVERVFIDGCSNTVPNHTLEKLMYDNFKAIDLPKYTDDELAFAEKLTKTYSSDGKLPGIAAKYDRNSAEMVREFSNNAKKPINDFLAPLYDGDCFEPGSTDVGDVSWQTPTAQLHAACFAAGSPGHSWQNVSCGGSSIGHKGLLTAAKVLCGAAIDLLCDETLLESAKAEFSERSKIGYFSPIPDGAKAVAIEI